MLDSDKKNFSRLILRWYRSHARDLPWRRTHDPYAIWVSEIMLQQTQVDTVIEYYKKWMKQFPTVKKLAKSPLSVVLKYWAGLGYYRRARSLHESARMIIKDFDGHIPADTSSLKKLPGIGDYTAGAISSIAFKKPSPLVDGNVIRVLSRIFALKDNMAASVGKNRVWEIAGQLIPNKNPGDFNQALMELGATVCSPLNPKCPSCPMASICKAFTANNVRNFPYMPDKEKLTKKKTVALILEDRGQILIQKQPKNGRWGGLWMFPFWDTLSEMKRDFQIDNTKTKKIMTVHHGFTKYKIELSVFHSKLKQKRPISNNMKWVNRNRLNLFAFPSPHQKIVKGLTHATQ